MYLVGAYLTVHGVAYSWLRGSDSNLFVLGLGWGATCFAKLMAMYFLG
ncbi:hypothetical protein AB0M19_34785 [Streptomyces sp. NPDC051920]